MNFLYILTKIKYKNIYILKKIINICILIYILIRLFNLNTLRTFVILQISCIVLEYSQWLWRKMRSIKKPTAYVLRRAARIARPPQDASSQDSCKADTIVVPKHMQISMRRPLWRVITPYRYKGCVSCHSGDESVVAIVVSSFFFSSFLFFSFFLLRRDSRFIVSTKDPTKDRMSTGHWVSFPRILFPLVVLL